jgi:hypothetical protein
VLSSHVVKSFYLNLIAVFKQSKTINWRELKLQLDTIRSSYFEYLSVRT